MYDTVVSRIHMAKVMSNGIHSFVGDWKPF